VNNYFRKGMESTVWFANDPRSVEPGRKPNMAMAWVGKGCVGRCTFCQRFSKGYHLFDLKKFEEHIKELKNRHDVQYFILTGENFGLPRDFAYDVARILKKHEMLWFAGGARCTNFRPEDYKFFRECGCIGLKFGVESGSQKILDIMEKMFSVEQLTAALKVAADNGMLAPLSLCIGMPGETDETIMQTGKFIGEISRMQGIPPLDVAVFYALPLPGAPLYEYGQLHGVIGTEPDEEEQYLIYISDRDSDRTNYINMTGVKTKKVLFWEHMIFYEANRVFYSSPLDKRIQTSENKADNADAGRISKDLVPTKESRGNLIKKVITKNPQIMITALKSPFSYLNGVMCRSRFATKIPRSVLYPIMRNLIYLEYSINLFFRRIGGFITNDRWNRLDIKFKKKKCSHLITTNESLRQINDKIRQSMPAPATLTEKNQILLYKGR
ncbi:MAG: radical SAM protein, partial [Candidatus Woesearchaeota archaeon]|nr:radical SAM protein [Candidatus Woesearchaeota archaeon]